MIKCIFIAGAGQMGSGIAQVAAVSGYDVVLYDIKQMFADAGKAKIATSLEKQVSKGRMTAEAAEAALKRITPSADIKQASGCDLAIEAATENPEIKKKLFRDLDDCLPEHALMATNTSSISITELGAVTKRANKVVGMHFFNPAPVMKLVEVIKGIKTSDETVTAVYELAKSFGKEPVVCKDSPGFIVNRLFDPMLNEAAFLVYEGIATPEDIDKAMINGLNHPMGPIALMDMIGIDVLLNIMEVLYAEFGDSKYRPCPLLRKMVAAGELGKKSGKGFYDYTK
ncbi:MAG: 3-hydroxyacyl-CoA dehydrogenase family protein [Christensenellales bacterium]